MAKTQTPYSGKVSFSSKYRPPNQPMALTASTGDELTQTMLKAINGMMLDMLAAIARKDYQDRRGRLEEGIVKAKGACKFRGHQADLQRFGKIIELRVKNRQSIRDTAKLCGVSERTVIYIVKKTQEGQEIKQVIK